MSNAEVKTLKLNPVKVNLIKATTESKEKNSKGDSVSWLRLPKEIKDNGDYVVTSKNNCEYAAKMPGVNISSGIDWLKENQELANVQEWFGNLFVTVNRPIIAAAGAAGLKECELIADVESLIAFDTLESARGRKASRFDADQWKLISPLIALGLKHHFEDMKLNNVQAVANKYLGILRTATFNFAPMIMEVETAEKIDLMVSAVFGHIIENSPEHESLAAMLVGYWEKWKEVNMQASDEY